MKLFGLVSYAAFLYTAVALDRDSYYDCQPQEQDYFKEENNPINCLKEKIPQSACKLPFITHTSFEAVKILERPPATQTQVFIKEQIRTETALATETQFIISEKTATQTANVTRLGIKKIRETATCRIHERISIIVPSTEVRLLLSEKTASVTATEMTTVSATAIFIKHHLVKEMETKICERISYVTPPTQVQLVLSEKTATATATAVSTAFFVKHHLVRETATKILRQFITAAPVTITEITTELAFLKPKIAHYTKTISRAIDCCLKGPTVTITCDRPITHTIKKRQVYLSYATSVHQVPVFMTAHIPSSLTDYFKTVTETFIKKETELATLTDVFTVSPAPVLVPLALSATPEQALPIGGGGSDSNKMFLVAQEKKHAESLTEPLSLDEFLVKADVNQERPSKIVIQEEPRNTIVRKQPIVRLFSGNDDRRRPTPVIPGQFPQKLPIYSSPNFERCGIVAA